MSHEIREHDGLVLAGEPAWHKLGSVVEEAPTPLTALQLAGLDWEVKKQALVAENPDDEIGAISVPGHFANVRSDTLDVLGVVGESYRPVQNRALAEFAEALAEAGDEVRVESAGSIRNGRRVWFLLRGESFAANHGKDEIKPYICLSNGHDGTAAMRATPTSIRVVCSNTLHMVIPRSTRKSIDRAVFKVTHSGDIREKVAEAKAALRLYSNSLEETRGLVDTLAARDVTRSEIQDFWLDVYQTIQTPVPSNPKTAGEKAKRTRATEAMASMAKRFDDERHVGGATAWNALNAVTGWVQHDRNVQGQSESHRHDNRTFTRLMGEGSKDTHRALGMALHAFS